MTYLRSQLILMTTLEVAPQHVPVETQVKEEVKAVPVNSANVLCTIPWLFLLLHPAHDSHENHVQHLRNKPGE